MHGTGGRDPGTVGNSGPGFDTRLFPGNREGQVSQAGRSRRPVADRGDASPTKVNGVEDEWRGLGGDELAAEATLLSSIVSRA